MIKENKYCREVMKKYFNKELAMTKEDNRNLKNYINVRLVTMIMLIMMLK